MSAKHRRLLGALSVAAAALLLAHVIRVARFAPLALTGETIDDGFSRASGVLHVHTTFSDGGGPPEDVIEAAREEGLDFVAITDHNNLDALPSAGYHGETLVLVGSELSTTAGHILGLGIERDPVYRFSGDALDGLLDIRELGGFPVAAHPLSPRRDLAWSGWDLQGPWGIELVNGDSAWRGAGLRLLATMALYQLNGAYALVDTLPSPVPSLKRWDELLERRDVTGLYGTDAHARIAITDGWLVDFPSYRALFAVARNHVLLEAPLSGDAAADRRKIVDALREGRAYIGLDALAPAGGLTFLVESPSGERFTMGQTAPIQDGLRARVGGRVPAGARIRLLRDGGLFAEGEGTLDVPLSEAGVYRVEVHLDGWDVPWVITNPVAILDDESLAERRRAAAWPEPLAPVPPGAILDDFDGATIFEPGHDTASSIDDPILDPDGGVDNGGGLRLSFHLGEPTPEHPDVFAAVVSWEHRDLSAWQGLTFWIRGDGLYRLWIQVRDENPDSADEGTEWWFASVKTATEWRPVTVPFSRLRSLNPRTDGQLDLDAVRALVLVIDKGAMKPGSRGTIWLDALGLY